MMPGVILKLAALTARIMPAGVKRAIYRTPWLASKVRSGLNRAAPQGVSEVVVAAGALAGMALFLDLQFEKDYWLGTYEPELQEGIVDLVKPGMVVYDLGANIGYISLLLARQVGDRGRVYAFEALPVNQDRLRANIQRNRMGDRVIVVPAAVADRTSTLHFWVGPSGGMGKLKGSAGRQNVDYPLAIEVPGISLDDFIYRDENPVPAVIKIDIEGGEVLALPGMRKLLSEEHPLLFLELHGPDSSRIAWQELTDASYRVCYLAKGYPTVPSLSALDWKSYLVCFPS